MPSETPLTETERQHWQSFCNRSDISGLTVRRIVERDSLEPHLDPAPGRVTPAGLRPDYSHAVLLGSGGPAFWEQFDAQTGAGAHAADPLDAYTELVVDDLVAELRPVDPEILAAYPFRHERQIIPFQALTASLTDLQVMPFGVSVDRSYGPWFAWRAVVLTVLPLPADRPRPGDVCTACPAPCTRACPVGAANKAGLDWERCSQFRLSAADCRETCLAREACPVGARHRYGQEQLAYHHGASLRTLLSMRQ